MSERRSLDRLLLPKMRAEPEGVELLVPESSAPLPRWRTLPLDAKFPVTPAAKDEVTFVTTRICQPAYRSAQHETFDLTDPYNRTIQTEYQALRDPYLKDFLAKPHIRKKLLEQNLVTPSGKIPCTVRDFNNYRNFLRHQALIKNKEPESLTRATENRNLILRQTKMRAELVSVEVKCKSLKAQQMLKEAEEEKQRQFWRKQALEAEREQKRLEEENKSREEMMRKRKEKWLEKQKEIQEKEEITRKEQEQKVLQIELEAQEKLNKVEAMKQFKQHLLEARRKQQWHQKRQYQMKVLEEAMMQQKRVEIEMEMRRRQYEDKMASSSVKFQGSSGDTLGVDETMKTTHEDSVKFITGQGKSQTVSQRNEPEMNLSRRVSMWILEEVLYSSGMFEEVNLLFSASSPQEYSHELDQLVGSVTRTTRGSTVLGVEQDALSKIIHLVVRQLENAYHRKEQEKRGQETVVVDEAEAECVKRFFRSLDARLETETAHRVCMSATLDMDCKFPVDKSTSGSRPDRHKQHEQRARLFSNHLRLPEPEITEMETELTQLLIHFQKSTRPLREQKQVLAMFLNLACPNDSELEDMEHNSNKPALENKFCCPSPVLDDRSLDKTKMSSLQTDSGTLVKRCMEKVHPGGKEDACGETKMLIERKERESHKIGGNSNETSGDVVETETNPHTVNLEATRNCTEVLVSSESPTETAADDVGGMSGIEMEENTETKNRQRTCINNSTDNKDADFRDHMMNNASFDHNSSTANVSSFGCNKLTANAKEDNKTSDHLASSTHIMDGSVILEDEDLSCKLQPEVQPVAELTKSEHNFYSTTKGFPALSGEALNPEDFSRDTEQPSGMQLTDDAVQGDGNKDNEVESCEKKESQSNYHLHTRDGDYREAINAELSFTSATQRTNDPSGLDPMTNTVPRSTQENIIRESEDQNDIVCMAAKFVMKMQQRSLQGAGLPPAKIHYIITTFLSRLWWSSPGETAHFRTGLYNKDVASTTASLLYHVKTTRLPQDLIDTLTDAIAAGILYNLVDFKGCLPEGVITTAIHGFTRQLKNDQVNVRILEDVLCSLQEEYDEYLRSCQSLQMDLFLVETLTVAEELLSKSKVTSNDFVKNILDYAQLSRQSQVTLIYSPWKSMLHQARVAIQLSAVSSQDRAHLTYLVLVCGEKLTNTASDSVSQCVEQLRSRMQDEIFMMRSAVTLSASVVATLLHTVAEKRVSGLTLLPGAVRSRSALSPGALGQDSTGPAIVLLTLDSLARDMGEDTLDSQCLGHIAASLVDLLTREYSYQCEALEGDGLAGGLDCMTSLFRCKSLEFADSCKILSAILRPYLGCLLKEERDTGFKVDLGEPVPVDEDLLPSLFDFITEVFVTFVGGVIARMRRGWVGNDLPDDLLVLYAWRTMASLAKEANTLLCHKNASDTSQKTSFKFTRWNLSVPLGLLDTFKGKHNGQIPGAASEGSSTTHGTQANCVQERTESVRAFMACMSRVLPEPGYVPVPDLCISNQTTQNDSLIIIIGKAMTGEAIPTDVANAARREIISACQLIFESMVTVEALHKIKDKLASHITCAVFVIDKLTTILSEKMWVLKERLSKDSLTVNEMIPFLVNCQDHVHIEVAISKDSAFKILTLFILELEAIQQSVTVLRRLVERLTRLDQHATGAESHASGILYDISSSAFTQFIRAFIVSILKMVAWMLEKICHEKGSASMKAPLSAYTSDVAKLAIAVVCDGIKVLKKAKRKEAKTADGCVSRLSAGLSQDSFFRIPKEVSDNVFGCLVDIIENIGSTDNDTEIETPLFSDMVALFISQILTSVTAFADSANYHFIYINDLLLPDASSKRHAQGDAGGHNVVTREKREINDLVTSVEQKESEYLLHRLVQMMTSISHSIKQEINDAVLLNQQCDSLLQAFAFVNVKVGKVQQDLAKKSITLLYRQFNVGTNDEAGISKDVHLAAGDNDRVINTVSVSKDTKNVQGRTMTVSRYIENLFRNVTDLKLINKDLDTHPAQVIKAILKACYAVDVSFLAPECAAMNKNEFIAQSVLLVEIIINEMYNKLTELEKVRTKEIDKETNYPYLFSRTYTNPDPMGPYYSDVAVRARQLTDTVRVGCVTRSQVQRSSAVSSLMSSKDESVVSESSRIDEEIGSTAAEEVAVGGQAARESRDPKSQNRVSAWRRKVQNCSMVHSKDNTLKMWVKADSEITHKMSRLQKKSKMVSTGKQINAASLNIAHNVEKLDKVDAKDCQTNHQLDKEECHKRLISATTVEQKPTKSSTPAVKSLPKQFLVGKKDDPPKQQIKRSDTKNKDNLKDTKSDTKNKDNLKDTKDDSPKTRAKIRQTAAQKHVIRMTRSSSVKSKIKSTEVGGSSGWPKTVHIIHHAYIEKSNTMNYQMADENKAALSGIVPNQLTEEQPPKNQTTLQSHEKSELKEEHPCDQQLPASTRVLVSFLEKELPRQSTAVRRCLGQEAAEDLEAIDLANVLGVVDLALDELDRGDELQAARVLEGGYGRGMVSQRTVGAIDNLLRSLRNNNISDEEIEKKLVDEGTHCQNVNILNFRHQLITSLSMMAERAQQGNEVPEFVSCRQGDVLEALRYVREMSHSAEGEKPKNITEEPNYESDVGSSAGGGHSPGGKMHSNSLTPSLTSVSASEDDSNDDKCIISSSWTILTSCPSLSSSRSSNIAQDRHEDCAAENKQRNQKKLKKSPRVEGVKEPSKAANSKTEMAGDFKDGSQPSGHDSKGYSEDEESSQKDADCNPGASVQISGRCSRDNDSMTSQRRQLSDESSKAETDVEDPDEWSVSGHSSKTGGCHNCTIDGNNLDGLPATEGALSQNKDKPASEVGSWSSSPQSSRCSSGRSSRNEGAGSLAHSLSSLSTTSTQSGEVKDTRDPSRRSSSDVGIDQNEVPQNTDDQVMRSSGARGRDDSEDSQRLSEDHKQLRTLNMAANEAPSDPYSDRYSTDHESGASKGAEEEQHSRKMGASGVKDVMGGGDVSCDGAGDVDEDSEM